MRYKNFTIKNFKGIQELYLDLDTQPKSKIITLVGLNESGKTSVLEALTFIQESKIPENLIHKLIPKNKIFSFNEKISVKADIEVNEEDNKAMSEFATTLGYKELRSIPLIHQIREYEFTNSNFKNENNRINISFEVKKGKERNFNVLDSETSDYQELLNFVTNNLMPSIIYYPNFLFDFPNKIYLDANISDSEEQRIYNDLIQDILSSIDENSTIENHLLLRLHQPTAANNDILDQTLGLMGAQITRLVFSAWGELFGTSVANRRIILKTNKDEQTGRYYIEFRLEQGASQYYIEERSLGFRWFFFYLLFTEVRKNRIGRKGEILFLLDEPANNLHSTAQKKLLKTFDTLTDSSRLIYTTHSHHMIDPAWLNGAYIVKNKALKYEEEFDYDVKQTEIETISYKKFVYRYPDQREYFQPILDTLEYQPGLLEKVDSIIVTEGKFDYYTYKYINTVYFNNEFNLNFYPGGGAHANLNIIRLYIAWQRNFKIILDGDQAGEKAKKTYFQEIGREIEQFIITYRDIEVTWNHSTEDLFTESEKIYITKLFSGKETFDKSAFNTSIQNLLHEKAKIDLSLDTLNKFKKIFESLATK